LKVLATEANMKKNGSATKLLNCFSDKTIILRLTCLLTSGNNLDLILTKNKQQGGNTLPRTITAILYIFFVNNASIDNRLLAFQTITI
jgi:hypothetical protein